jgi:RNA polymerase sigma factor (sigma-70 family)
LSEQWDLRDLLEKHHHASYGWALHCCGRRAADAEEVLQESYLKVLDGRARYNGKAAFKTWLFAVIRTTAANERRRRWLGQFSLLRYERERPVVSSANSPAENRLRMQEQAVLQHCLAQLPARQQEVLHLTFYQELTIQQAAEVMGVSLGTARQHYERGKEKLRMLWRSQEGIDEKP